MTLLVLVSSLAASIVGDVRAAAARNDFAHGEALIAQYRAVSGVTPEMIEALSWLGRGALAAGQPGKADAYAAETRRLALAELGRRPLDSERHLPIALGASIEVQAQVMAAGGGRAEAVDFLRRELEAWRATSIGARIQKNLHLLSLEGKPAPPLELRRWLGPRPSALAGRPLLLFFWAHWCGDCKQQVPVLARLEAEFAGAGLAIVGPTQRYGYTARGQEASFEEEVKYIDQVRLKDYAPLASMPVPLSEENFRTYGASTTPTLVLIDRRNIVRLYHPGAMSYEELKPGVAEIAGR